MAALYILIPVALIIVAAVIWLFFWAVDNGQYEDLETPAHSVLFDGEDEKRHLTGSHSLPPPNHEDHPHA